MSVKHLDLPGLELAFEVKLASSSSICLDVLSQSTGLGVNSVLGWLSLHYSCEDNPTYTCKVFYRIAG